MASPFDRAPSRRQSMLNTPNDGDRDLAHSLKQLSLSISPTSNSPRTPSALSPLRPAVNRTSPAPSPRVPSRSSSFARELSRSRSSTPTLQRSSTPTLQRKTSTSSLHSVGGSSSRAPSRAPSRRTSMAHASSPVAKSPLRPSPPEFIKPPPTANTVAREYFKTELGVHHSPTSTRATEALVILHDACYGHRFSRPKTSRAALSTIVERPERIKAGVLGVAMAYVRLGERHCDGAYAVHPSLDPSSIPNIPFRIYKTDRRLPLTSPAVTNVHGTKWMEELKMMCDVAEAKLATGGKELQRPELNRGAEGPPAKFHEGDLYLCSESLEAFEGALGAVCEAVDRVFTLGPRRAFVAVRPPGHHCSASYPSGFCWINNVHVGIMHAILEHGLTHAAILDIDLHHGDGSQAIAWAHNTRGVNAPKNAAAWKKASIGYFSLHDINSYPCEMGDEEKVKNASLCIDNAHGQNIYNVHLESYGSEKEFWELYESRYAVLLEKTRKYLKTQAGRLRSLNLPPKAAIFLSAGFDASEWETKGMQRHNVNVPTEFYARIAQDVVRIAAEEGLGVDGRVISVLEGGYSDRALYSGIFSHLSGLSGDQTPVEPSRGRASLGHEMGQKDAAGPEGQTTARTPATPVSLHPYKPSWWSASELDELEVAMGNRPPSPKMVRHSTPPTYSTPTQASIGKAVDPARMRRMASGLSNGIPYSRPPTPPPPDVHWTVAAHELSRLLIPSDRQVDSCKPEDLNAEATRARRDRQSMLNPDLVPPAPAPAPTPAPVSRPTSRMSLRERKPARPGMYVEVDEDGDKQFKNRRKTVAGPPALSSDKAAARGVPSDPNGSAKLPGRRLSGVSSAASNTPETEQGGTKVAGPRPDTAMSARPDSAMSVRTQAGTSLTVKKTRAPAAKKEAPKTTRTVKKPTAPANPPPPQSQPSQAPQRKPSPAIASEDDMDKLTAGMKKIKINLITKRQKEERAKTAQSAQAKAATPPAVEQANPTFPAEVETPIAPSPVAPPVVTPPQDETFTTTPTQFPALDDPLPSPPPPPPAASAGRSEVSTPVTEQTYMAVTPDTRQLELPASSPATSPAATTPSGSDVFVNYQPAGPAPVSVAPQESLTWLPPNTNTPIKTSPSRPTPARLSPAKPSPAKKSPARMMRADLPVFSSTSAIPFAPQGLDGTPEVKQELSVKVDPAKHPAKRDKSIWEIPETPQK